MSTSPWPPPGTVSPPEPRPRPLAHYRSPVRLTRLFIWIVAIGMLVAVAAATVGYAQLRTFNEELAHPGTVPPDQLTNRDNWREVATAAVLVVLLVWWGLLIAWTHRLYRNLEPLGFRELRFGTGWAIGGWFVPFLNVVRPKQVVNDIWRSGDPALGLGHDFHERPASRLLAWWWLAWLVLLCFTSANVLPRTDDHRERSVLGSGLVWIAIFELAFGALTLLVVVRTTTRQARLAGDESPDPHNDRVVAVLVAVAIVALLGTLAVSVFLSATLPDRVVTGVAGADRADHASPDRSVRGGGL